eukprot:1196395-Prorocentrum_minimum.AAC.5
MLPSVGLDSRDSRDKTGEERPPSQQEATLMILTGARVTRPDVRGTEGMGSTWGTSLTSGFPDEQKTSQSSFSARSDTFPSLKPCSCQNFTRVWSVLHKW